METARILQVVKRILVPPVAQRKEIQVDIATAVIVKFSDMEFHPLHQLVEITMK